MSHCCLNRWLTMQPLRSFTTGHNLFSYWLLLLLLTAIFNIQSSHSRVQIIPKFTNLPPDVTPLLPPSSPTSGANSNPTVSLTCRAWPANTWIGLLAADQNRLYLLPHDLARGLRFGLLPANRLGGDGLDSFINQSTLAGAIRRRPAALASDQLAVGLTLPSRLDGQQEEMRRLERMQLHCLVATPFGRLLSRPFRVRVSSLADFDPAPPPDRLLPSPSLNDGDSNPNRRVRQMDVLHNNIAYVTCTLPSLAHSYPRPLVQFEFNQQPIEISTGGTHCTEKYCQIAQPDGRRVFLLIRNFGLQDVGSYQCTATNPLTGERKHAPEVVELKLFPPSKPVGPEIIVPLATTSMTSSSSPFGRHDPMGTMSKNIIVRQGQNVTLFCIIQSSPPSNVKTYPHGGGHNQSASARFRRNDKFGLLEIINVQPGDAGPYICSKSLVSSSAVLVVKPRLTVTVKPQLIRVSSTNNTSVQFTCTSSDPDVTPYWLFNGQPPKPGLGVGTEVNLVLDNVTDADLGIYQCIASRQSFNQGEDGEMASLGDDPMALHDLDPLSNWASATGVLASDTDQLIRTPDMLAPYTVPSRRSLADSNDPSKPADSDEPPVAQLKPKADYLFDNLAVMLRWRSFDQIHQPATSLNGDQPAVDSSRRTVNYKLEYSVQTSALQELASGSSSFDDGAAQEEDDENLLSLIGLRGHKAVGWSPPKPLDKHQTSSTYAYIYGAPLEAARRYRFRIRPIDPSTGMTLSPPSTWSNVVSLEHISPIDPPHITSIQPLSNGDVDVEWSFNERQNASRSLIGSSSFHLDAAANAYRHHLLMTSGWSPDAASNSGRRPPSSMSFQPDHFLLLARSVVKPSTTTTKSRDEQSSSSIEFGSYRVVRVNGSDVRQGRITGLNRTLNYQILIYGVRGQEPQRSITGFSKAFYVNLRTATSSTSPSGISASSKGFNLFDAIAANRLLYIILGSIVGLMLLSMLLLITLCLCRRSRNSHSPLLIDGQRNGKAKSMPPNGYLQGMLQQQDKSSYQQHPHHQHAPSNCSNSLVAGGMSRSLDQPLSQTDCNSPPQQHYQPISVAGAMAANHHLHQSHQSLLLSGHQPQQPVFHGGTLPHPGLVGRQLPPHPSAASGRQSMLMMPIHSSSAIRGQPQQRYASQMLLSSPQSQQPGADDVSLVYARHPRAGTVSGLPPHAANVRPPFYYQSGAMTPGAGSMMREPHSGGNGQDRSTYGTLVQRGLIGQPGSGGGGPPPNATYHQQHHPSHLASSTMIAGDPSSPGAYYSSHHPIQPSSSSPFFNQHQMTGYPAQFQPVNSGGPASSSYHHHQGPAGIIDGSQGMSATNGMVMMSPPPSGFAHTTTDGESIYSYFSQQQDGLASPPPPGHQPLLNPLPEEGHTQPANGQSSSYVESGMQTNVNGGDQSPGDPLLSTNGDNQQQPRHRHHRRRKRKQASSQQQQQSDDTQGNGTDNEGRPLLANNQQSHSINGSGGENGFNGASELSSDRDAIVTTASIDFIKQGMTSPSPHGQFNQSPYAPPPPMMALQDNSRVRPTFINPAAVSIQQPGSPPPMMAMNLGGGSHYQPHPHTNGVMGPGNDGGFSIYQQQSQHLPPPNQPPPPPPPPASGLLSNGGGGPPPRIRDYSEYGIPRGIGLQPTAQLPSSALVMDGHRAH